MKKSLVVLALAFLFGSVCHLILDLNEETRRQSAEATEELRDSHLLLSRQSLGEVQALFAKVQDKVDGLQSVSQGCARKNLVLRTSFPDLRDYLALAEESLQVMLAEEQNLRTETDTALMLRRTRWVRGLAEATDCLLRTVLVYAQLLDGEDGYSHQAICSRRPYQGSYLNFTGEGEQHLELFLRVMDAQHRLSVNFVYVLYRSRDFCLGPPWGDEGRE